MGGEERRCWPSPRTSLLPPPGRNVRLCLFGPEETRARARLSLARHFGLELLTVRRKNRVSLARARVSSGPNRHRPIPPRSTTPNNTTTSSSSARTSFTKSRSSTNRAEPLARFVDDRDFVKLVLADDDDVVVLFGVVDLGGTRFLRRTVSSSSPKWRARLPSACRRTSTCSTRLVCRPNRQSLTLRPGGGSREVRGEGQQREQGQSDESGQRERGRD
jgi:hypothetical protein